jgi:hypothetical protein
MKAPFLVLWPCEIEYRARHYMVDVPHLAVIIKRHARLKPGLKVNQEIFH